MPTRPPARAGLEGSQSRPAGLYEHEHAIEASGAAPCQLFRAGTAETWVAGSAKATLAMATGALGSRNAPLVVSMQG